MKMSYELKKRRVGLLFLLPWILGSLLFFLYPLIQSFLYSISKLSFSGPKYALNIQGFTHYVRAFTSDSEFLVKVSQSIGEMLYQTPIIVLFSLFMAVILNQDFKGRVFVRGVFFLPVIIASGVIISVINGDIMSQAIMSSNSSSNLLKAEVLNSLLYESGIPQNIINTITGVVDSMFSLIWKSGIQILIFLAGLQVISVSLYEAAKIDGATGWEVFWKITFPMISPMILLNLIFTVIDAFTDYNNVVMNYINSKQITMEFEYSAALSWLYFIMVLVVVGVIYAIVNKKVEYQ